MGEKRKGREGQDMLDVGCGGCERQKVKRRDFAKHLYGMHNNAQIFPLIILTWTLEHASLG